MKWKNIDAGAGYYYITGTFTEWLPLFERADVRELVCESIRQALEKCRASLAAYVIMPDHIHLLVYLPEARLLHRFNKLWRGRSGRKVPRLLDPVADAAVLEVMHRHANGGCRHAIWKEQVRALAVWDEKKLQAKVNYIHANPLRRGLVDDLSDWPFSSYQFYEKGESGLLRVTPPIL